MTSTCNNRFWLALSLVLMLFSGIVASRVQSAGGSIDVTEMRWKAAGGSYVNARLYKPVSASNEHPAPAIVVGHGWWNSHEMQGPICIELARRGYVALSVDMYGHGGSDDLKMENIAVGGTGMYDGVQLTAELPYVDASKIAVCGHSHGARAANFSVELDNAAPKPLIKAVVLVDNNPIYTDSAGQYVNFYGARNVGLVADRYDEFYFRSYSAGGDVLTPPRDYIATANAQSFLHFGADPRHISDHRQAETFYDESGTLRITYTPTETHPWSMISRSTIASQIDFFERTFGAPKPIAATSQIWQFKEAATAIGMVGFGMFLVAFTRVLLETPAFVQLKRSDAIAPIQPTFRSSLLFAGGMFVFAIGLAMSYVVMSNFAPIQRIAFNNTPTIFAQGAVFLISSWQAANGVACLILMAIVWWILGRNLNWNLRERGIFPAGTTLRKSLLLSLLVVTTAYFIVFAIHQLFGTDFRFWVIAIKPFSPAKLKFVALYLPLFATYFIANSIFINCFNPAASREKIVMTWAIAFLNAAAPIAMVTVQYATFFRTGYTVNGLGGIFGIWLFPVILNLVASAVISRRIYLATNNPYLGGFISSAVVTIMAVANTLTVTF